MFVYIVTSWSRKMKKDSKKQQDLKKEKPKRPKKNSEEIKSKIKTDQIKTDAPNLCAWWCARNS